jgi:hypothetical protein
MSHFCVTNTLFPFQTYNNFIEVIKRKILQNSAAGESDNFQVPGLGGKLPIRHNSYHSKVPRIILAS